MRYVTMAVVLVETLSAGAWAGGASEVRVYNGDVIAPFGEFLDYDKDAPLEPMRIVAARNGTFSGKVVVGTKGQALNGVSASMSDLVHKGGRGVLAAKDIQVRYAYGGSWSGWGSTSKAVSRYDVLRGVPPSQIRVVNSKKFRPYDAWIPDGLSILPIWVTVRVPADAAPGDYAGALTVKAAGRSIATRRARLCGSPCWSSCDDV